MTREMLNRVTVDQLARLHPLTKRELLAWFANQIQIFIGHADNIVADPGNVTENIDAATAIAKTGRKLHAELQTLLAERAPETVGAEEKA